MTPAERLVKYQRAEWAEVKCDSLAKRNKLYKYTIYPIDKGLAKLWKWWYRAKPSDSNMPS
jgi:hypothetical protein